MGVAVMGAFPVARRAIGTTVGIDAKIDVHGGTGWKMADVLRHVPWPLRGWEVLEWEDELRFVSPEGAMVGVYAVDDHGWGVYGCDGPEGEAEAAPWQWSDASAWLIGRVSIIGYLSEGHD